MVTRECVLTWFVILVSIWSISMISGVLVNFKMWDENRIVQQRMKRLETRRAHREAKSQGQKAVESMSTTIESLSKQMVEISSSEENEETNPNSPFFMNIIDTFMKDDDLSSSNFISSYLSTVKPISAGDFGLKDEPAPMDAIHFYISDDRSEIQLVMLSPYDRSIDLEDYDHDIISDFALSLGANREEIRHFWFRRWVLNSYVPEIAQIVNETALVYNQNAYHPQKLNNNARP